MNRTFFRAQTLIIGILLAGLLTGCQGIAFSPESAVQQEVLHRNSMHEFQIDPTTYQQHQTIELDDISIVLVSFQGNRLNSGRESCLFLYETFRSLGGWVAGSGGGGCSNEKPDPENRPISVGMNRSGGRDRNDPGTSVISGQIYHEDITAVKITWADGQAQDASVANQTFLAARKGNFDFQKIEAADSQGLILFTEEGFAPAAGKE